MLDGFWSRFVERYRLPRRIANLESNHEAIEHRLAHLERSDGVSGEHLSQAVREQSKRANASDSLVDQRVSDLETKREAIEHRLAQLERLDGVSNQLQKLGDHLETRGKASERRAERVSNTQDRLVIVSAITAVFLAAQGILLFYQVVQLGQDVKQREGEIRAQEVDRQRVRRLEWLELIYPEECLPYGSCGPAAHPRLRQEAVVSLAALAGENQDKLDLSHADLSGLDFSGIDFSDANLESVDFSGTNLTDANFTRAKLVNAELANATMVRAKLYGADLNRSVETLPFFLIAGPSIELFGVLQYTCGDSETLLPKIFKELRPKDWLKRPIHAHDPLGTGCPDDIEPPP